MPPHRRPSFLSGRKAFSLVELSVVIVIISIVAVMGLEGAAIYMDRTAYNVTRDRLREIDEAIAAFYHVNGRLPCPSRNGKPIAGQPILAITDTCFGKESNGTGGTAAISSCVDTAATCQGYTFSNITKGDVPVRDLGLPLSYAFDAYGNRIFYAVTAGMVSAATFNATNPALQMRSGKLDSACTSNCQMLGSAAYVVLSHGRDRRGAYSKNGGSAPTIECSNGGSDMDRIDTQNCRINRGAAAGGYEINNAPTTDVFYDSRYNAGSVPASYFDDIVVWRKKSDL